MGGIISGHMEAAMKKNMDLMKETQQDMLERQIQMNNYMRERQAAMQMARARDMLHWWFSFYVLATVGMVAGFSKTKKPGVLAPLLPLTFIVAYQGDLAYGDKMHRIRAEAEKILTEETGLIEIPQGLPTVELLDKRRLKKE